MTDQNFLILREDQDGRWVAFPSAEPMTYREAVRVGQKHIGAHAAAGLEPDPMMLIECSFAPLSITKDNIEELSRTAEPWSLGQSNLHAKE